MACSGVHLRSASDSFTRPADTNNYSDNDLVANSTAAGSVEPLEFAIDTGEGRGIEIVGIKLQKSGTAVTGATFTVWLFASDPTSTAGDNVAFATTTVDTAGFIGQVDLPAMEAYTDDAMAQIRAGAVSGGFNPFVTYLSSTSTIYGLIQAAAAYTDEASAETFTCTIFYKQYE